MLCFVLVTALMAKSHLVVRQNRPGSSKSGFGRQWLKKSPPLRYSITVSRVSSLSVTSSRFTILGCFNILMVLTSQKSSLILEKLSFVLLMGSIFVLLMGLLAITPGVVRAKQAWGLRVWLWPPVSEKYLPR